MGLNLALKISAFLTAPCRRSVFFGFSLLAAICCHADGGAILARQTINGLGLTVFATPTPLRAGPVDVSVLVQQGETPLLDARVEVEWTASPSSSPEWVPPCCTMESRTERIRAVRAHSNNRLLYSAVVPMRSSGPSRLLIKVTQGGREALLACEVEVRPPWPPALSFWPWIVFPPIAIAGFALHQRLMTSRQKAAS